MHHDYKWLSKESRQAYGETEHVMPVDLAEFATQYHEHMKSKELDKMIEQSYSSGIVELDVSEFINRLSQIANGKES